MNVLIVDDDIIWARALSRSLQCLGHSCRMSASAEEAMRSLAGERFALMVTDVDLGGAYDGIDLACWAHNGLRLQVVILTGGDEAWVSAGVLAMGAPNIPVLSKGSPSSTLLSRITALDPLAPMPADQEPCNDNSSHLSPNTPGRRLA